MLQRYDVTSPPEKSDSASAQSRLAEYRALRAELMAVMGRVYNRLVMMSAAVSALLIAGAVTHLPELSCLAWIIVASAWRDAVRDIDHNVRIGKYIELYHEQSPTGPQWETLTCLLRSDPHMTPKSFSGRLKAALSCKYGIMSLVCVLATLLLFATFPPASRLRLGESCAVVALSAMFVFAAAQKAVRFTDRHDFWDGRLREMLATVENQRSMPTSRQAPVVSNQFGPVSPDESQERK